MPRGRLDSARGRAGFGPEWLVGRLAALLPRFPEVELCVALSGGVDSTALLAALAQVRSGLHLRAVHINHGIHPNSPGWARHCRAVARRLGVPLRIIHTKVLPTRGASLEAAAREARYALLARALRPGEVLLTAHQQDDQLETVLLQLFRGSGVAGLAAMPELSPFASGWHARPLLSRSREELERWLRAQGLTWIEDDTNADEKFDRNFLRRRVLPLVRERWPGAPAAVARSARHAAEAQRLLDLLARVDVERASHGESLSVKALRILPPDRRRNALRYWIARAGRLVPDTRRLEEIASTVIDARPDAHPFVQWGDTVARRQAGLLTLQSARRGAQPEPFGAPAAQAAGAAPPAPRLIAAASSPGAVAAGEIVWMWRASSTCSLPDGGKLELKPDARGPIDLDALPQRLRVTWRRGGERLRPRRGGPRRALKRLLQEAQLSVAERARLPLIFAEENLIAVADAWVDESVQASSATLNRARVLWARAPVT